MYVFPIFDRILRDNNTNTDVRAALNDLHLKDVVLLEFSLTRRLDEEMGIVAGMKVTRIVRLRANDPRLHSDKYF